MTAPPHKNHYATCKHNNGVEYRHCDIIIKEQPKSFQIGLAIHTAILGCCSWEKA